MNVWSSTACESMSDPHKSKVEQKKLDARVWTKLFSLFEVRTLTTSGREGGCGWEESQEGSGSASFRGMCIGPCALKDPTVDFKLCGHHLKVLNKTGTLPLHFSLDPVNYITASGYWWYFLSLFFYNFMYLCYLFFAALCLHRCLRVFPRCGKQRLLSSGARASHCSGFPCCGP